MLVATVVGAGLTLTIAGCLCIAVRAMINERRAFRPTCTVSKDSTPLAASRPVSFDSAGINIHGEFVDTTNGRVVLLIHGTESVLQDMYARAEMLIERGYGVLLIDLPGHGQSGGRPTWDEQERNAVRRAIDFCQQQPSVGKRGVLALGFSSGAYILAQVALTERRLVGVVLEGCYTSIGALVNWQYRRYGWFSRYPAFWTDRYYGMKSRDIQPIDIVQRIAPIATFLIAGTEDRVVPAVMGEELYAAAREPKVLWLVDGAGHGDYQRVAPTQYAQRIAAFLEAAWTQKGA